uniref:Dynein regulatory complex subunit 2 n=1 Tax=Echeneis naucrates TaxID=173247 RepID=A0A665W9A0_ECHNA
EFILRRLDIMPKKAKKGGGRMEFLQQRAQAEEEMAKKREETLAQFLKDKLEKEEKNTAGNLRKLNDGWRGILRQTRDLELRQEISIFSQTFERQLDGLDNVIKVSHCHRKIQPVLHTEAELLTLPLPVCLFCRILHVTSRKMSGGLLRGAGITCSVWSDYGLCMRRG